MRPPQWHPPIELSNKEKKSSSASGELNSSFFAPVVRHELFDQETSSLRKQRDPAQAAHTITKTSYRNRSRPNLGTISGLIALRALVRTVI